jgi:hypothetical protein
MPPLTPLLAGTPISNAHSPAKSYMPHVYMTLSTSRTRSRARTRSPVTGFTPPLASVAPIVARSRHVTVIEHCRRYSDSSASTSPSRMSWLRMR